MVDFASLDAIDAIETRGCKVYAPMKDEEKQKEAGKDPYARKPHDTDAHGGLAGADGRGGVEDRSTGFGPRRRNGSTRCAAIGAFGGCRCVGR